MSNWNYADVYEAIAPAQPDQPAIIQGDRVLSWGELEARSRSLANKLWQIAAEPQAKVAAYLYNSPEYLETTIASFRAGLVPVNTNYRYGAEELLYLWDNADVVAVVFHGSFSDTIEELRSSLPAIRAWLWVDDSSGPCPDWAIPYEDSTRSAEPLDEGIVRGPDDLMLLYTGGTTGMPKGVMWRQDDHLCKMNAAGFRRWDLEAGTEEIVDAIRSEGPGNRLMPACPLMHGTGLWTALEVLVEGGCCVLLEGRHYDPAAMAADIDRFGVNVVVIVGDPFARPLLEVLDAEPGRFSLASLVAIVSSGAMWSEETKAGLLRHLPNALLVDLISSSEAIGMGNAVSRAGKEKKTGEFRVSELVKVIGEDDLAVEPGSDEIGMLALGGRIPLGYYKDPDKSATTFRLVDGARYSVPGDFAKVRADGSIQLLGRGSQCINTAGEKVFPEEVEEVLKRHGAVRDAVVVGIPDPRTGERVVAAVELSPGAAVDEEVLIGHVKAHLAHYKAPRAVHVVDSIGRTPAGKLDYRRHKDEAMAWEAERTL